MPVHCGFFGGAYCPPLKPTIAFAVERVSAIQIGSLVSKGNPAFDNSRSDRFGVCEIPANFRSRFTKRWS
jgi:hypothetical protein